MSSEPTQPEPSEEELRAALEEQLRHITAFDVIAQTAISLINLAGRRLGLSEDTKDERDLGQVRDAIDAARALLPVLERDARASSLGPVRDALSSLQMEYARLVSEAPAGPAAAASQATPTPEAGAAGPAQQSGRLWVPDSTNRPRR
jgi:hypothetical protein